MVIESRNKMKYVYTCFSNRRNAQENVNSSTLEYAVLTYMQLNMNKRLKLQPKDGTWQIILSNWIDNETDCGK